MCYKLQSIRHFAYIVLRLKMWYAVYRVSYTKFKIYDTESVPSQCFPSTTPKQICCSGTWTTNMKSFVGIAESVLIKKKSKKENPQRTRS